MVAHVGTIKCICGLEVGFGEQVGEFGLGGVGGGRGGGAATGEGEEGDRAPTAGGVGELWRVNEEVLAHGWDQ